MLTFGPYTPDQPELNGGTTVAQNVLPRTVSSYGPIKSLSPVTAALTNRAQGAGAFVDKAGGIHNFCGDSENIFKLNVTAWGEQSAVAAGYTTATDDTWNFIKFGEVIVAVNGFTDNPQAYTLNVSTDFAALAGSPPQAKHIAVIKDFVVLGNLDEAGTVYSNRLRWSAINDVTDWPTIGSADAAAKQSDQQDLPVGGEIQAIIGAVGGSDGAVFTTRAIYRMQYGGPPTVFSILPIEEGRGTKAPNSVVNVGPFAFFLAPSGFYRFTGSSSIPIGDQKVDKDFYDDLDHNYLHRIYGAADPINKIVAWAYPGSGNANGQPNRIIFYDWAIDRWSLGNIVTDLLFTNVTPGYTLEQLDSFGTLDGLPASLDDNIWIGGSLAFGAFDTDKKMGHFTGANMAATIETQEAEGGSVLALPHHRMLINGVRPYVDVATVSDVTIGLKYRDNPGTTTTTDGPNVIDADGMAHFTRSTRFARAVVNIAAGATWSHAQGLDFDASDDGVL
jgi:hypothetical protein